MKERNFTQMTRKELKAYIKQNPTNDDAIRELFINRRSPDAKSYPSPYSMTSEELSEIFSNRNDNS